MQSSSTFLGFLGNTAYFRFVLLKLMVNLKIYWMENVQLLAKKILKHNSFKNLSQSDWDGGRTPVAESYSAGGGCLFEHGGWQWPSGPSSARWGTSDAVRATVCSLGGNRGPTERYKVTRLFKMGVVKIKAYRRLCMKQMNTPDWHNGPHLWQTGPEGLARTGCAGRRSACYLHSPRGEEKMHQP